MKFLSFLFLSTLFILSFFSCSETDIQGLESELIGDWWISDIQFEGSSTTNSNGNDVTSPFTGTGYNLVFNMNIEKDQHTFSTKGLYNIHLITLMDGQSVQTEWMNPGFIEDGNWEVEDDKLVVTKSNGEIQSTTVISVNDNTLVLAYDFLYEVMKSETKVTYLVQGIYTFARR